MITTKNLRKKLIIFGLGLALSANLLSYAAPTKPSTSYANNIPSISKQQEEKKKGKSSIEIKEPSIYETQAKNLFEKLYQKNTVLTEEIGKIPEFLDGLDENEVKTLEKIVDLYVNNQDSTIENAFKEMLNEGNPKVRKYCTPLRFLFWATKEGTEPLESVSNYNLEKMYGLAAKQVSSINDFKGVIGMLNSPQLIDLYERSNFQYEFYIGSRKTDEQVFKSKKANCKDTSEFTVYCLRKAGYNAGLLWVDSKIPEGHIITYFKDKEKIFIMDNGKPRPDGIKGPYDSLSKIPYKIRKEI